MGEFSQLLCGQPQHSNDHSIAVAHNNEWRKKHDQKLVPGKHYPLCVRIEVYLQALLFHFPRVVVIKQSRGCFLKMKQNFTDHESKTNQTSSTSPKTGIS